MIVSFAAVAVTGDRQAKVMTQVQPMKMAAAEALYDTKASAGFSIFTIGTLQSHDEIFSIRIPGLLSFLATDSFTGTVEGINDIQAQYEQQFGPGNYKPNIPITYWTFRLMIGTGLLGAAIAAWVLWKIRRGRPVPGGRWYVRAAIVLPFLPLAGNSFGWIFTEMGRQPWIVFGQMFTTAGVSPSNGTAEVVISLVGFTLLYGALAVVELGLMLKVVRGGLPEVPPPADPSDPDSSGDSSGHELAFAY
ncbi:MAG: cytochrome ubiquinol oxidase subunit I [Ilumatobacteraceae bacterium]